MSAEKSVVRNLSLAPQGRLKMDWAWDHMPVLRRIREQLVQEQPLKGKRVAISLHLEAKTSCPAVRMPDAGAEVATAGSDPLATQDDVAAGLVESGITDFATYKPTSEEYEEHLMLTLETRPELIIDDG